tara:strand:+ start:17 stop:208 length:192 start_codon:yes stop_codon:yes gene_type:complete
VGFHSYKLIDKLKAKDITYDVITNVNVGGCAIPDKKMHKPEKGFSRSDEHKENFGLHMMTKML